MNPCKNWVSIGEPGQVHGVERHQLIEDHLCWFGAAELLPMRLNNRVHESVRCLDEPEGDFKKLANKAVQGNLVASLLK